MPEEKDKLVSVKEMDTKGWTYLNNYYLYDTTNGVRYPWIKLFNGFNEVITSDSVNLEFIISDDSYYPYSCIVDVFIKTATISGSVAVSIAVMPRGFVSNICEFKLCNDGSIWIRCKNVDWNSWVKFRSTQSSSNINIRQISYQVNDPDSNVISINYGGLRVLNDGTRNSY